jgi:hypothetical protein
LTATVSLSHTHPAAPTGRAPQRNFPVIVLLSATSFLPLLNADDDFNDLTIPSDPPVPARTTWTLLLYLTSAAEGCVGGETVFYPHDRKSLGEEIAVPLETGMLLLHKHGHDCLLVCSSPSFRRRGRQIRPALYFSDHLTLSYTLICASTLLTVASSWTNQHEGREVLDGEKWVIRTDLCVRR